MPPPPRAPVADLRGAARLAVAATAGLTDLVEAMHQRIASAPGATAADGRTRGITGLVYRSIRGVTKLVGGSVDGLLGLVSGLLPAPETGAVSAQREAIVAALNGVLGDHLAATANPLATAMALRQGGQALDLDRAALCRRFPQATGTVLVMLHGLCMNDLQWLRDGHDHGAALAPLLGAEPLYLNYNSGLPLAENGRQFAALMAQLLAAWPVPVERLVLLAHSMGGLVARSALQQAGDAGQAWQQLVSDLVCLGTPHLGAALERAGHGLDLLLDATPYAGPLARLGRMRSAGITDLRHGLRQPDGQPSPLPTGPRCWAVAAVLDDEPAALKNRLLGDGLVSLDSALGRHDRADGGPGPTPRRQHVVHGINHMQLLSSPEVAAQLRQWLHQADSEAA